ncbi:MAG TPA: hypothetical protein VHM90_17300 [Phycisphaerae bacterium]|nr:hypothetical protein [Phycisphaerae bacterium]
MNDGLEDHVRQIVDPIHAGPWRKEIMRRDLLAHLHASAEAEGTDEARRRFGNREELQRELQDTVPRFEQFVFGIIPGKETSMWRWIAIILASGLAMTAVACAFPGAGPLINMGAVALVSLLIIMRLWDRKVPSIWRSSALLLIGIAGGLTGPAIILPAWAKMNQGHFVMPIIAAMTIGIIITLEGIGFIVVSVRRRALAS